MIFNLRGENNNSSIGWRMPETISNEEILEELVTIKTSTYDEKWKIGEDLYVLRGSRFGNFIKYCTSSKYGAYYKFCEWLGKRAGTRYKKTGKCHFQINTDVFSRYQHFKVRESAENSFIFAFNKARGATSEEILEGYWRFDFSKGKNRIDVLFFKDIHTEEAHNALTVWKEYIKLTEIIEKLYKQETQDNPQYTRGEKAWREHMTYQ